MKFSEYLKEAGAGLSRIYKHMSDHDTGMITAFRYLKDATKEDTPDNRYTKKENLQRNKSLLLKLQSLGYGVISVSGVYIENYKQPNAIEVAENTFFVIDLKDKGNLKKDLLKLGEKFDQDSILFIPKGGKKSILIGTNHTSEYPGYHKEDSMNLRELGKGNDKEFFTKIKGRPFVFRNPTLKEHYLPNSYFGKWSISNGAKKDSDDLESYI